MIDFRVPTQPDFEWKSNLADLLLDCPSIAESGARALIVRQLAKNLRSSLHYSPVQSAKQDVFNIVDTCLNYPDGISQLLKIVYNFDEGTIALEKLTRFLSPRRIFLSYKRDVQPDEKLALSLYNELSQRYSVFIDQRDIPIGEDWANRISQELLEADFLIALLSEKSVKSEMLEGELRLAYNSGKPRILPVRVNYREPFRNPLDIYLNRLNWAVWNSEEESSRLMEELERAIGGAELSVSPTNFDFIIPTRASLQATISDAVQLLELDEPGGTMPPDSPFYIMRQDDAQALRLARRTGKGETITIRGARQMGKSSLLMQLIKTGQQVGKQVTFIDFQLFERTALDTPEIFYRQFCRLISDGLELLDRTEDYWQPGIGATHRCTRYIQQYVLKQNTQPVLLAMDEVEMMLNTPFRSDFFGMLRTWHNSRASTPVWRRLDLVMVTSTEPYQLIDNPLQSPFNVGATFRASEFTPNQLNTFNKLHNNCLDDKDEIRLYALLGGQPFLTHRALYLLATKRINTAELFEGATRNDGPFGDHLRHHLFRLSEKPQLRLADAMRRVLGEHKCDDDSFFRLESAGLVHNEGSLIYPRCKLYEDYFREHL
jgi:hypothetical protein